MRPGQPLRKTHHGEGLFVALQMMGVAEIKKKLYIFPKKNCPLSCYTEMNNYAGVFTLDCLSGLVTSTGRGVLLL